MLDLLTLNTACQISGTLVLSAAGVNLRVSSPHILLLGRDSAHRSNCSSSLIAVHYLIVWQWSTQVIFGWLRDSLMDWNSAIFSLQLLLLAATHFVSLEQGVTFWNILKSLGEMGRNLASICMFTSRLLPSANASREFVSGVCCLPIWHSTSPALMLRTQKTLLIPCHRTSLVGGRSGLHNLLNVRRQVNHGSTCSIVTWTIFGRLLLKVLSCHHFSFISAYFKGGSSHGVLWKRSLSSLSLICFNCRVYSSDFRPNARFSVVIGILGQTSLENLLPLVNFLVEYFCLLVWHGVISAILRSIVGLLSGSRSLVRNFKVTRVVWLHLVRLFASLVTLDVLSIRGNFVFHLNFLFILGLLVCDDLTATPRVPSIHYITIRLFSFTI